MRTDFSGMCAHYPETPEYFINFEDSKNNSRLFLTLAKQDGIPHDGPHNWTVVSLLNENTHRVSDLFN